MTSAPIDTLRKIMIMLRNKETGCPWDVQQTHQSIAHYAIEEAYELADAIERNHLDDIKSELGDILLQVVFHSRIAQESGHFDFDDVANAICTKMIERHPHVFGHEQQHDASSQHKAWEEHKDRERRAVGALSQMDNIPITLPAITRAEKIQQRAARVGFDWKDSADVISKIYEELEEVQQAHSPEHIKEEIGDVLFTVVNLARHHNIRADEALKLTNIKFERRFRHMEEAATHEGRSLKNETIEQLETRWQVAKRS